MLLIAPAMFRKVRKTSGDVFVDMIVFSQF